MIRSRLSKFASHLPSLTRVIRTLQIFTINSIYDYENDMIFTHGKLLKIKAIRKCDKNSLYKVLI